MKQILEAWTPICVRRGGFGGNWRLALSNCRTVYYSTPLQEGVARFAVIGRVLLHFDAIEPAAIDEE